MLMNGLFGVLDFIFGDYRKKQS